MPTDTQMLLGAIGALTTVIIYLWNQQRVDQQNTKEELKACKTQHADHQTQYLTLSVQLAEIRGENKGIKLLADQVLRTVAESQRITTTTTSTGTVGPGT